MENGPASCISRILIVYLVGGALLLALARYARGDQAGETLLNDSALSATPLADGDCGEGDIDPAGDVDFGGSAAVPLPTPTPMATTRPIVRLG